MGNGLLLEREVLLMHPLCLCKSTAFVLTHALLLSFSSFDIKGVLFFFWFERLDVLSSEKKNIERTFDVCAILSKI